MNVFECYSSDSCSTDKAQPQDHAVWLESTSHVHYSRLGDFHSSRPLLSVLRRVFQWGFPANILYTFLVPHISCWSQHCWFGVHAEYSVTSGQHEMAFISCYLWPVREHSVQCLPLFTGIWLRWTRIIVSVTAGPQIWLMPSCAV